MVEEARETVCPLLMLAAAVSKADQPGREYASDYHNNGRCLGDKCEWWTSKATVGLLDAPGSCAIKGG